jgi:hypothetical protein
VVTDEEYIILLRLCARDSLAWRHDAQVAFFRNITKDWQAETGKTHTDLSRVIRTRIHKRRKYLQEEVGSGKADAETEQTIAEDLWIAVLDAENKYGTVYSTAPCVLQHRV